MAGLVSRGRRWKIEFGDSWEVVRLRGEGEREGLLVVGIEVESWVVGCDVGGEGAGRIGFGSDGKGWGSNWDGDCACCCRFSE